MTRKSWAVCGVLLAGLLTANPAAATEVRFFRQQSTADFVEGDFEGVALDAEGALRLAPQFERLASVEEPFVFTARSRGEGWLLGTGNAGRVLAVTRSGEVEVLWTAPEPEIFALWVDEDGTAFAGTSPDGKVYVLGPDGATEFFDPAETYIWDIARAPWGDLLVATGDGGKLYAVAENGEGRVLFESAEPHLRALHPLAESVLIGTAGEGLILSVDAGGKVRTLFDSDQEEVTAFADDGSGQWYAAAVAAEASLTQRSKESKDPNGEAGDENGEVKIEVSATPGKSEGTTRSTLVRGRAGEVRTLATLQRETVYALGWLDDRLWLGTGVEGNVYSLTSGRLALEASVEDRQVVGLFPGARSILITTNGAAVHRAAASSASGTYVSQVLDAGAPSRFGSLRWRGSAMKSQWIGFSLRSGLSSEPDATWTDWSLPASGDELDLAAVPAGRFFQWRAGVSPKAAGDARLSAVLISYRQNNSEPTVSRLVAMDPGQVLVPASFSPDDQIYEPAHPNRAGIFKALQPTARKNGNRLKTLWRSGFLTLRWQAEDPNEDELAYGLAFRAEDSGEDFLVMEEDIEQDYFSFDATVLPDGVYRFRLRATDRPDNSAETALTADRISEPVVVDHTPPYVVTVSSEGGLTTVEVRDELSPIREAEVSVDGGEWTPAQTSDALLDGQRETLRVPAPPGARLVLLRITDAAFNSATYNVLEKRR